MELQLQKERLSCYEPLPTMRETHEETAETIVPDYCPDIARVVDASGCLFIRESGWKDGRVSASGIVRMTVLYATEEAQGLKSFTYNVPFEHTGEERFRTDTAEVCVCGKLLMPEVRLLNPRKVFTRVAVELTATPYSAATLLTCGAIPEQETYHIQLRCEKREVALMKAVREKDFSFADSFALSAAKAPIREILRSKAQLCVTDVRTISDKIVIKGNACVEVLYLAQDDTVEQVAEELPFSQMLDGIDDTDGETFADASLCLTGAEVSVGGDDAPEDDRTISVQLYIHAFAVLRQNTEVHCITDLYSTTHDLTAEREERRIYDLPRRTIREQAARETVQTGADAERVICAGVSLGDVSVQESGKVWVVPAHIRVLYADENGAILSAERRTEVRSEADDTLSGTPTVAPVCPANVLASVTADGIEVRFTTLFMLTEEQELSVPCLTELRAELPEEKTDLPSLVLRALAEGEELWDVAKRYRTTVEDILSANEWTEETAVQAGQLLLIPRKR